MTLSPYVAAVLVGVVLIALDYVRTALKRGLRDIPGPFLARFTTLYRISMTYKGQSVKSYRGLHNKYGKIVRTGPWHVSISDPEMVPLIYGIASKFRKSPFYSTSVPFYEGEPLDNMFTAVSPALHKALRSPTAQVYSMTNLRHYEKHANECTEIFIRLMKEKEGQTVDVTDHFLWYAFDVIASVTFQRRLGFMETQNDVWGMIDFSEVLALYFAFIGQLPFLHPYLFGNRRLIEFLKWANPSFPDPLGELFEKIDAEMRLYDQQEKTEDRKDFLAQLRVKDDPSRLHYKRDMLNHLSNNVLAGSDTTAVALRAIFYFVIKNPRVYEKLMIELDENDKAGKLSSLVTYEEASAMPYLQAVIKEAMRVHPSNCWPLERVVPDEGATVCGIDLPGGTIVSTTAPLINLNTDIYGPDAKEFRPERWLDADTEQLRIMDRHYFTVSLSPPNPRSAFYFGAGSRACIGRNIALLEITKFVPQIFRMFEFEWASDSPEWEIFSMWFYKQKGVVLKWKSRPSLSLGDAA